RPLFQYAMNNLQRKLRPGFKSAASDEFFRDEEGLDCSLAAFICEFVLNELEIFRFVRRREPVEKRDCSGKTEHGKPVSECGRIRHFGQARPCRRVALSV